MIQTITETEKEQELINLIDKIEANIALWDRYSPTGPALQQSVYTIFNDQCVKKYYSHIYRLILICAKHLSEVTKSSISRWSGWRDFAFTAASAVAKIAKWCTPTELDNLEVLFNSNQLCYTDKSYTPYTKVWPEKAEQLVHKYCNTIVIDRQSSHNTERIKYIVCQLDRSNLFADIDAVAKSLNAAAEALKGYYYRKGFEKWKFSNDSTVIRFNQEPNLNFSSDTKEDRKATRKELFTDIDVTHANFLAVKNRQQFDIKKLEQFYNKLIEDKQYEKVAEFLYCQHSLYSNAMWFAQIRNHVTEDRKWELTKIYNSSDLSSYLLSHIVTELMKKLNL